MNKSRLLLLASILAVGLLVVFVGLDPLGDEGAGLDPSRETVTEEVPEPSLSRPVREVSGELPVEASRSEREFVDVQESDPEPELSERALARVVGRILLPSGAPAIGAVVKLGGWGANQERKMRHGVPEDWVDPEGVTDATGRFELELDPPLAFQFALAVTYPGHAGLSWRWSTLPPGRETDIGVQTLSTTGVITGKVTRADGSPTGNSWRVYADSSFEPSGPGADNTRVSANADAATGEFRLEGLPAGTAQLKAYSRISNWITGPTVTVVADQETSADILYRGPDNRSRITVVVFCRPFYVFNEPAEGEIVCSDGAGNEWIAEKVKGSSQSYSIEDLDSGLYTIRIDSPLHKPWSKSNVKPGQSVNAHLVGNAAVSVRVTDAASGQELTDYRMKLRFDDANFSPSVFEVREAGAQLPAGGLYQGLIPKPSTLIFEVEGYAALEVKLSEVPPNATLPVNAALLSGGSIRGVVRFENGKPAEGAKVLLHPHHAGYDPEDVFSGPSSNSARSRFRSRSQEGLCDSNGRFEFSSIVPGDYDLRVTSGALLVVQEHLLLDQSSVEVELQFPAMGALEGKLLASEDVSFAGLQICTFPPHLADPTNPYFREATGVKIVDVGADGSFRLNSLPAKEHAVELLIPGRSLPTSFSSSSDTPACSVILDRVTIEAGGVTEVEFTLGDNTPGRIHIEATCNGEPAAGLVLRALRNDGRLRQSTGGILDASGKLTLAPLFAGTWQFDLKAIEGPWRYTSPERIELSPGGEQRVLISFTTARGRMRVLSAADDAVLASYPVKLGRSRDALITDSAGWIEFDLLPGTYELRDGGEDGRVRGAPATSFEWTTGGPVVDEVRLELSNSDG